jgi:hypothetical protein
MVLKTPDLVGKKFDRLTVVSRAENYKDGTARWNCVCDCGNETTTFGRSLRNGRARSCGCLRNEYYQERKRKHGGSSKEKNSLTYDRWKSMRSRIGNDDRYKFLIHCERWKFFESFVQDMGLCPSQVFVLDRVDGTKGYSKENCRWATKQQNASNRFDVLRVDFCGISFPMSDLARDFGVLPKTAYERIQRGWDPFEAC